MANLGYIQLTRTCNQKCRFCSNPEAERTITLEEARDRIAHLKSLDYRGVILTGGEPTLYDGITDVMRMVRKNDFECRMVTNGQKTCDFEYLKSLVDAGLQIMNVSLHSSRNDMQSFLTDNPDSLKNITATLENACRLDLGVNINTVINSYNADHLDDTVRWIVENFPCVYHFVWNNIDPTMNRASENRDTIPRLWQFEINLAKAAEYILSKGLTFRVERVPLCFMTEYAQYSTETRKIVKNEERTVHFLDERGYVRQMSFEYGKGEACAVCFLNEICAGLYEMDTYYSSDELYPVFIKKEVIIDKILGEDAD